MDTAVTTVTEVSEQTFDAFLRANCPGRDSPAMVRVGRFLLEIFSDADGHGVAAICYTDSGGFTRQILGYEISQSEQ